MDAVNEITGEVQAVMRRRFDVIWCPFCDRSRQIGDMDANPYCDGCRAKFQESVAVILEPPPAPAPDPEPEDVDLEQADVPAPTRRRRA
jgi:hypothetical protein